MSIEIINGESWEVFEKYHKQIGSASISIQKGGNIRLNTSAYEALGKPTYVTLSYDPKQHTMAIQRREVEQKPNTRVRAAGYNHIISGHAFAHYNGIDCTIARQYKAILHNKVLIIDLNKRA